MRGSDERSGSLFSYVDIEARVPRGHPLRRIRELVNGALSELDGEFAQRYSPLGRPSIPAGAIAASELATADLVLGRKAGIAVILCGTGRESTSRPPADRGFPLTDRRPPSTTSRVQNGKVAEHWDIAETIPPRCAWKNDTANSRRSSRRATGSGSTAFPTLIKQAMPRPDALDALQRRQRLRRLFQHLRWHLRLQTPLRHWRHQTLLRRSHRWMRLRQRRPALDAPAPAPAAPTLAPALAPPALAPALAPSAYTRASACAGPSYTRAHAYTLAFLTMRLDEFRERDGIRPGNRNSFRPGNGGRRENGRHNELRRQGQGNIESGKHRFAQMAERKVFAT
ncbi:MAG: hypothetical protein QOI93_5591 [Rhodospirillaceae bacterium]|nr:hypothetical protein [Rhodospirillaceae bacterium]